MNHPKPTFYGTATIGSKGQIVIPAEAREELGIQTGDKMIVIGIKERGMVGLCPVASIETLLAEMSEKLAIMQKIIDEQKKV